MRSIVGLRDALAAGFGWRAQHDVLTVAETFARQLLIAAAALYSQRFSDAMSPLMAAH